jgi:hypothetical protein
MYVLVLWKRWYMVKRPHQEKECELEPDAWQRFERAVDVVAKSPPQHRTKQKPPRKSKNIPKGRKKPGQ